MRGGMFSVGEPLSHQTVLVAGAGVDILFFPGEKLDIERVSALMRWNHLRLLHLITLATSHVLFPVLGDQQHQHYPGLLVSLMTDLRVFSV